MTQLRPAIFLDRDGVLIEDVDAVCGDDQVRILPGVFEFLPEARGMGFLLAVASNQTVIARGLATEAAVCGIHERINGMLEAGCGVRIDRFYFCPHHPEASLADYRLDCGCRKPKPGLLLAAAAELGIDLARSFMIGDRMTDIVAGSRSGCATILVKSGRHLDPPIVSAHHDPSVRPDFVSEDLPGALAFIRGRASA